ncbi:MAG: sigma-70 family RNA polymerase sigma factor [Acidobacteriaceae bacterium]|nr:sigma-70 family RNA polymerase sigma factor [Acidobacteriaceae bacterium]
MAPPQQSSVTVASLMARFRSGDREAADQLFSLLYPELRRLAAAKMKAEGGQHSWQPSLLVNELYLQLVKVKSLPAPENAGGSERDHFLRFAGHVMRHLLIDHSRPLSHRITKIDIAKFETLEEAGDTTLQEIDELLEKLASIHPRLRSVVEMKVFEGLSVDEIAVRLGIAPRTVARNWTFSKEWLREKLQTG